MKKSNSLILIVLFLLLPFRSEAQSQSMVLYTQMPDSIEKTIIREMPHLISISYVETASNNYFVYHFGDTNILQVIRIDNNLTVNDFVIDNDSVFFCGENTSGVGFLGYFSVQDFFFGSGTYTVTVLPFQTFYGDITTFDRLEAYPMNGCRVYVAIGKTLLGNYALAEVRYYTSGLVWSYVTGALDASQQESLIDIALTKNYVVTAGFIQNSMGPLPCLRIYWKSSVFNASGPQDESYFTYFTGIVTSHFDGREIALSHMVSDTFALSVFWHDNYPSGGHGTIVGMYNIIPSVGINSVNNIQIPQYYLNGNWRLRGMTPMLSATQSFYLLQNVEEYGYSNLVDKVLEISFSSFGLVPISYRMQNHHMLQSIDAQKNDVSFVTNGPIEYNPNQLFYYCTNLSSMACCTHGLIPCGLLPMKSTTTLYPFSMKASNVQYSQNYVGLSLPIKLKVDCYQ